MNKEERMNIFNQNGHAIIQLPAGININDLIITDSNGNQLRLSSVTPDLHPAMASNYAAQKTISMNMDRNDNVADTLKKLRIEAPLIRNNNLWRRWITAQYFRMYNSKYGLHDALRDKGYYYQFKVTLNELRILHELAAGKHHYELFERKMFFGNSHNIAWMLKEYIKAARIYVKSMKFGSTIRVGKGKHATQIKSYSEFDDLITEMNNKIRQIDDLCSGSEACPLEHYEKLYYHFKFFVENYVLDMPGSRFQSSTWKDMYLKAGAYYTLKNLLMFHDDVFKMTTDRYVHFENRSDGYIMSRDEAVVALRGLLITERYDGYQFHALFKRLVKENKFDLAKRLRDIHNMA